MKHIFVSPIRSLTLALAAAAALFIAGPASAQLKTPTKPVVPNKELIILPGRGGVPDKTVRPGLPGKSARPTRQAMIVLLENGGISSSLKLLMKKDLPKVPVAKYKSYSFEMKMGETIPQLLARMKGKIALNAETLNPANWKIEMVTMESALDPVTDYLAKELVKSVLQIQKAKSKYDRVVVLEGSKFNAPGVLAEIRKLAPDYVLDIHVVCHGGNGLIAGANGAILNHGNFFKPLMDEKKSGKLNLHLRTVYQINCKSGTLVQAWMDLGAAAVAGTKGAKNNYLPHQYFHFMDHWLAGKTFGQSVQLGYQTARVSATPLYVALLQPGYLSDSQLFVAGTSTVRLPSK